MAIERADFPLPDLTEPLTAPFYEAAAAGELRIPQCTVCGTYVWYPKAACPADGGALEWVAVSGRATLFTWAVVHRAFLPAFAEQVPFVTAVVALDEDPRVRIVTNVVDADPASLVPDEPVEVVFCDLAYPTVPGRAVTAPMFRPTRPT